MKPYRSGPCGFTLMELLISITILSVVMVLIMSALRISTRAWEKGERNIEAGQRLRSVIEIMTGQIEALRTEKGAGSGAGGYYFIGDAFEMKFTTTDSLDRSGEPQTAKIVYQVEKEEDTVQLLMYESKISSLMKASEKEAIPEKPDPDILIPSCFDVHFEYLKNVVGTGSVWKDSWGAPDDSGIPLAVRITIQEDEKTSPIRSVIRLLARPVSDVAYDLGAG